ncbi:unnamed protein product [marine sediment metagenome]|uniref:Uncharacterized protein n=1 Tax=marine sediment metagenome TaxID=412755 RepID=X1G001_9ZZZZ
MGANMIIATVSFPVDHSLEKEYEALVLFVKEMPVELIEEIYSEVYYEMFGEEEDFIEEARERITKTVDIGFKALTSRYSTDFRICDRTVYCSGGLSWGDAPTEAYEQITALRYILGLSRE